MIFSTLYRGSLKALENLETAHYGPHGSMRVEQSPLPSAAHSTSSISSQPPSYGPRIGASVSTQAAQPGFVEEPVWRRPFHNGDGFSPGLFNGLFPADSPLARISAQLSSAPSTGQAPRAQIPNVQAPGVQAPGVQTTSVQTQGTAALYDPSEGRRRISALATHMALKHTEQEVTRRNALAVNSVNNAAGKATAPLNPLATPGVQALPQGQRLFLQQEFLKEKAKLVAAQKALTNTKNGGSVQEPAVAPLNREASITHPLSTSREQKLENEALEDDFAHVVKRLINATVEGAVDGWDPSDPLGFDPETQAMHREFAGEYPFLTPIQTLNDLIGYRVTAASDAILRAGTAALYGGASLAGQGYTEATGDQGMGRRLERDLIALAHVLGARGGVAGGANSLMKPAAQQAQSATRQIPEHARAASEGIRREYHTARIANQLRNPHPKTTGIGKIKSGLLDQINEIRKLEGEPPIGKRDVRIYMNVLKKLQEKRIKLDGATPDQVARAIYRVVHGRNTIAERGKHKTSHQLVNTTPRISPKTNDPVFDVGYVGRGPADDVSVKSIMKSYEKDLRRKRKRRSPEQGP